MGWVLILIDNIVKQKDFLGKNVFGSNYAE